jgi:RNA polymerase sigma-70 factor (ECF subfamily)
MELLKSLRVPVSDEEIIDLYWERNERAIDETDFKYRKYLFTIAYNILYSKQDCEECLNDTYLGTWQAIPPSRPTYLKVFLTTIIRRVSINKYNEMSRQKRIPSSLTESLSDVEMFTADSSAEQEQEAILLAKVISDYLRTLSKRERYIFMSRYYVAQPIEKIAKELNVSRATVNKDIASIKRGLKEALEREGYSI